MKSIIKKPIFYVVLVAAAYRLVGVFYGLGHDFFGDSFVHVVAAFKMLEERTFNTSFDFYYLPPLMSYIISPFFAILGVIGMIIGKFGGVGDFRDFVLLNKEYFILGPRMVSFMLGVGSVYLIYLLIKRMFDEKTAIIAAVFWAFDFYSIHESHSGRIWVPIVFFIIASLYAVWRIFESELTNWRFFESEESKDRWYLLGAISIGLGYGMGYVPILMYPWLAAAHLLKNKAIRLRDTYLDQKFLWANSIMLIFVIIFSSANINSFIRQFGSLLYIFGVPIEENAAKAITGESNFIYSFGSSLYFLFDNSPFFLIFGVIGAFVLVFKYRNSFFSSLLIGFPLMYISGISYGFPSIDARYVLPVIPFLIILSAFAIRELAARFAVFGMTIFVVLTVLGVSYSFYLSTAYSVLLLRQDTRVQAVNWIHQNIKHGNGLLINMPFSYLRYENKDSIRQLESEGGFVDSRQKYLLTVSDEKYPSPSYFVLNEARRSHSKDELKNLNFEYVIYFFWSESERFFDRNKIPEQMKLIQNFYPAEKILNMRDFLNSPEEFLGDLSKLKYLGPYVEIYRVTR